MSLLRDIQNAAIDADVSIAVVLRKCKVLATRLAHEPFKNWVDQELDGYVSEAQVPDYRKVQVQSFGNFAGPFGSKATNIPIPPSSLPEEYREIARTAYILNGVAQLESLVTDSKESDSGGIQSPWPADLLPLYGHKILENMTCLAAWRALPRGALIGLLDTIRNRVLNFALEIEVADPDAGEARIGSPPLPEQRVSQVFNTYIVGGNNSISAGNTQFNQVTIFEVRQNDLDSLKTYLQKIGLEQEDVNELEAALQSEGVPESPKKLGGRVSGWIGKMVSKAASGAWDVTTSSAADLLTKALSSYYGLDS